MKRFSVHYNNNEEYGNIKRGFSELISRMSRDVGNERDINLLIKVRDILNNCSHCGGETDDSGTCYSA
jgi:hypothetical protein